MCLCLCLCICVTERPIDTKTMLLMNTLSGFEECEICAFLVHVKMIQCSLSWSCPYPCPSHLQNKNKFTDFNLTYSLKKSKVNSLNAGIIDLEMVLWHDSVHECVTRLGLGLWIADKTRDILDVRDVIYHREDVTHPFVCPASAIPLCHFMIPLIVR